MLFLWIYLVIFSLPLMSKGNSTSIYECKITKNMVIIKILIAYLQ